MTQSSPISINARDFTDEPDGKGHLMSAEAHYARGSELLRKAGADLVPFADMHAITTLARTHFSAARAATAIWPARLAELQAVAEAARALQTSTADEELAAEAKLAEALRRLEDA